MGTLVGSEEGAPPIGVAPGAKWIAVKVFNDAGEATDEWIHKGFQWCLAPTGLDGLNPDPHRAPDVVSNSWGDDDGSDQTFAQDLRALRRLESWPSSQQGTTVHKPARWGRRVAYPMPLPSAPRIAATYCRFQRPGTLALGRAQA